MSAVSSKESRQIGRYLGQNGGHERGKNGKGSEEGH